MTKRTAVLILGILAFTIVACGRSEPLVDQTSVERILSTLSADEMMGREAFTPGAAMAVDFIDAEYASIGLDHFGELEGYKQSFPVYSVTADQMRVTVNGRDFPAEQVAARVSARSLNWTEESEVNVVLVGADDDPMQAIMGTFRSDANTLVVVHRQHEQAFTRFKGYFDGPTRTADLDAGASTVIVLSSINEVSAFQVEVSASVEELHLTNVVGVIPGNRSDEYVLFGAHHDHLGIMPAVDGDSIANGANDDATGVVAVIELARYFKALKKPERTLVFIAFAAEEKGLIGSGYFAQQLPPEQVVTLFNVEMIGKVGPYGENSAWITGFDRSSFGELLQSAVEGTGFSFNPEATERSMFFSSDNAPFARLGIPAHSISTTDIEDGDYHQVSDEIETLDLNLVTNTIQAIARAAVPIVAGEATPTRVDVESLN